MYNPLDCNAILLHTSPSFPCLILVLLVKVLHQVRDVIVVIVIGILLTRLTTFFPLECFSELTECLKRIRTELV
jgi:hypothetical protein